MRLATVETVLKHWKDHAACRGMPIDLFVHRLGERQIVKRIKEAKAVCAGCPVRPECLNEALQLAHEPTIPDLSYGSPPAANSMTWSA